MERIFREEKRQRLGQIERQRLPISTLQLQRQVRRANKALAIRDDGIPSFGIFLEGTLLTNLV